MLLSLDDNTFRIVVRSMGGMMENQMIQQTSSDYGTSRQRNADTIKEARIIPRENLNERRLLYPMHFPIHIQ